MFPFMQYYLHCTVEFESGTDLNRVVDVLEGDDAEAGRTLVLSGAGRRQLDALDAARRRERAAHVVVVHRIRKL